MWKINRSEETSVTAVAVALMDLEEGNTRKKVDVVKKGQPKKKNYMCIVCTKNCVLIGKLQEIRVTVKCVA